MSEQKEKSFLWVLIPIFLGVIGGIIAYFAVKYDDPRTANQYIVVGLIFQVIWIVIWLWAVIRLSTLTS